MLTHGFGLVTVDRVRIGIAEKQITFGMPDGAFNKGKSFRHLIDCRASRYYLAEAQSIVYTFTLIFPAGFQLETAHKNQLRQNVPKCNSPAGGRLLINTQNGNGKMFPGFACSVRITRLRVFVTGNESISGLLKPATFRSPRFL